MQPLIEVRNLRYRYDDGSAALGGVDFELFAGETVAILGPNGAGKTTFVLQIAGLLRGEGEVHVCGLPVTEANLAEIRRRVGIVFQDPDEQLFMPTVLDDVAFGLLNLGLDRQTARQSALQSLEQVGMAGAAHKAPYHLSSGEKRRVAIAGVLAMNPEILILDEPTTHLDPPGRSALLRLLQELPQAKLVVTHEAGFAAALARRAVFFERGKIVARGRVPQILEQFGWGEPGAVPR
jgi:cobalt/nickel transport system ATP-binding protein